MGLLVQVYRFRNRTGQDYDCTNGGISSVANQLCLVNVNGPFEPSDDAPAAVLEMSKAGVLRIIPVYPAKKWFMFGGNYAACSDSRFREACEKLQPGFYGAVAIHDRTE